MSFTPQMIVNGLKQVVGSQRSEVFAVLDQSRQKRWPIELSMKDGKKEIAIEIGAGSGPDEATLWVMPIVDRISVKIEKGEIAGREITYNNVVRKLIPAGMWNGKASRLTLPKDGLMPPEATACVALLQQGKVGPILGCAWWGSVTS